MSTEREDAAQIATTQRREASETSEASATLQSSDRHTPASKTDHAHGARHESVRNLRLRDFICVAPDTSIAEAYKSMERAGTDGIFVCDGGRPVGVVTHRDLLARADQLSDARRVVRDFMRHTAQTIAGDGTLGDVVRLMNESAQMHVAVTDETANQDEARFVGAISDLDIITYLAESYPKETINLPPVAAQVMDTREGG